MAERVEVLASAPFKVAVSNNSGEGQGASFSLHVTAAGLSLPNGVYTLCDAAAVAALIEASELARRVLLSAHGAAFMQIQTGCVPANLGDIKDAASKAHREVSAALARVGGAS